MPEPNFVKESGIHRFLHTNCYHQIIYAKFKLEIYYPSLYERVVWHCKYTNADYSSKVIFKFIGKEPLQMKMLVKLLKYSIKLYPLFRAILLLIRL